MRLTVLIRAKNYILRQCFTNRHQCKIRADLPKEEYELVKRVLTYGGIIHNLNLLELYHITGTKTLMIDEDQVQRMVDWINTQVTQFDVVAPPSNFFQAAPNNFKLHKLVEPEPFKQLMREVQQSESGEHPLKKLTESKKKLAKENQYKGAVRALNRAREAIDTGKRLLCIDVEAFEFAQHKLLEIGFCVYENASVNYYHYIVDENKKHRNKKFVPDNRDNYDFGVSITLPLKEIMQLLMIEAVRCDYVVGHSVAGDIEWLSKHGFDYSDRYYFDTALIGRCIMDQGKRTPGLVDLLDHYEIKHQNLHNAGNDSAYTMQALLKLVRSTPYKEAEAIKKESEDSF